MRLISSAAATDGFEVNVLPRPHDIHPCCMLTGNKEWLDVQEPTDGWGERFRAMS